MLRAGLMLRIAGTDLLCHSHPLAWLAVDAISAWLPAGQYPWGGSGNLSIHGRVEWDGLTAV